MTVWRPNAYVGLKRLQIHELEIDGFKHTEYSSKTKEEGKGEGEGGEGERGERESGRGGEGERGTGGGRGNAMFLVASNSPTVRGGFLHLPLRTSGLTPERCAPLPLAVNC